LPVLSPMSVCVIPFHETCACNSAGY
jgi:hypothetical protein